MTEHEGREQRGEAARMLMERADEALAVARREQKLSPTTALNRAFYACFYAASAALVLEGREFVKHTGVRAAVHRDLVKPGRLAPEFGQIYDELFNDRSEADYVPTSTFSPEDGASAVAKAERFVGALRVWMPPGGA